MDPQFQPNNQSEESEPVTISGTNPIISNIDGRVIEQKPQKNIKTLVILVITTAIILAGIGFACYFIFSQKPKSGYSVDITTQDYGDTMPSTITRKEFIKRMKSLDYLEESVEQDSDLGLYATYYKMTEDEKGMLIDVSFFDMANKDLLEELAHSSDIPEAENPVKDFDFNSDYNKRIICDMQGSACMYYIHVKNTLLILTSFDELETDRVLGTLGYR